MTSQTSELVERLTRPIIGIENRAALEVFDIMCDRIRRALERLSSSEVTEEEVERVARAICGRDLEWRDCERACLAAGKCVGNLSDCVIEDARAAITAMRSAATSERKG